MWPELLRLPWLDLPVPTYGVMLALGLAGGVAIVVTLASRDGLDPNRVYVACVLTLVAAFAGLNLMGLVNAATSLHPSDLLTVAGWRGGKVFYGGLLAGLAATGVLARVMRFDWRRFVDAAVPGIAFGQALGRVGCF